MNRRVVLVVLLICICIYSYCDYQMKIFSQLKNNLKKINAQKKKNGSIISEKDLKDSYSFKLKDETREYSIVFYGIFNVDYGTKQTEKESDYDIPGEIYYFATINKLHDPVYYKNLSKDEKKGLFHIEEEREKELRKKKEFYEARLANIREGKESKEKMQAYEDKISQDWKNDISLIDYYHKKRIELTRIGKPVFGSLQEAIQSAQDQLSQWFPGDQFQCVSVTNHNFDWFSKDFFTVQEASLDSFQDGAIECAFYRMKNQIAVGDPIHISVSIETGQITQLTANTNSFRELPLDRIKPVISSTQAIQKAQKRVALLDHSDKYCHESPKVVFQYLFSNRHDFYKKSFSPSNTSEKAIEDLTSRIDESKDSFYEDRLLYHIDFPAKNNSLADSMFVKVKVDARTGSVISHRDVRNTTRGNYLRYKYDEMPKSITDPETLESMKSTRMRSRKSVMPQTVYEKKAPVKAEK